MTEELKTPECSAYKKWKLNREVKARKQHQCDCCEVIIEKGEKHFTKVFRSVNTMFPRTERYCKDCAPWIEKGMSYRQARINAFGSPLLRGEWRRPTDEQLRGRRP